MTFLENKSLKIQFRSKNRITPKVMAVIQTIKESVFAFTSLKSDFLFIVYVMLITELFTPLHDPAKKKKKSRQFDYQKTSFRLSFVIAIFHSLYSSSSFSLFFLLPVPAPPHVFDKCPLPVLLLRPPWLTKGLTNRFATPSASHSSPLLSSPFSTSFFSLSLSFVPFFFFFYLSLQTLNDFSFDFYLIHSFHFLLLFMPHIFFFMLLIFFLSDFFSVSHSEFLSVFIQRRLFVNLSNECKFVPFSLTMNVHKMGMQEVRARKSA